MPFILQKSLYRRCADDMLVTRPTKVVADGELKVSEAKTVHTVFEATTLSAAQTA